jgi:PIN domain nuclease of toxin-antitoxin system
VVLDTHAWIWWVGESRDLGRRARTTIEAADEIVIPAICLLEVSMLIDRGRLEVDAEPSEWMDESLSLPRVTVGPLTPEIAAAAVGLRREGFHGDPADRLIYATARVRDAVLLSDDDAIRTFEKSLPSRATRHLIW